MLPLALGRSVLVAITILLAGACAKAPGSATIQQPFEAELAAYDTVVVTAKAEHPAHAAHTDRLAHAIEQSLQARGAFAKVLVGENAATEGIALRVTLVSLEDGSSFARAMNVGGEAEMTVSCELVELGTEKSLGSFSATGSSSRQVRTSINGVDTGIADDLTGRAITATAEEVAQVLVDHR
jgi:hypothetical protein